MNLVVAQEKVLAKKTMVIDGKPVTVKIVDNESLRLTMHTAKIIRQIEDEHRSSSEKLDDLVKGWNSIIGPMNRRFEIYRYRLIYDTGDVLLEEMNNTVMFLGSALSYMTYLDRAILGRSDFEQNVIIPLYNKLARILKPDQTYFEKGQSLATLSLIAVQVAKKGKAIPGIKANGTPNASIKLSRRQLRKVSSTDMSKFKAAVKKFAEAKQNSTGIKKLKYTEFGAYNYEVKIGGSGGRLLGKMEGDVIIFDVYKASDVMHKKRK